MIRKVTDQIGYEVNFSYPPQRIVSLVPSLTELLFDINLDDQVVGITKFCIHPKDKVDLRPKIGGTKNFDIDIIHRLQPDIIIANKEENYLEGIEELKKFFPVWISDISNLEQAMAMISQIGAITGTVSRAEDLISNIRNSFKDLPNNYKGKALYLIWRKPYMTAGGDTFINEMMNIAGYSNILQFQKRYPKITAEEIASLKPDFILLSSEPFPFKEKHLQEFSGFCPTAKVMIVDGEMFSWFGSRMLMAADYFKSLE
ncbi:helical backbone metal receptor [soil metagenome]